MVKNHRQGRGFAFQEQKSKNAWKGEEVLPCRNWILIGTLHTENPTWQTPPVNHHYSGLFQ